jgi:hypothetical protein
MLENCFCTWQKLFLPGWFLSPGKDFFCLDGFFHGKKRFFPQTGKNLPTLSIVLRLYSRPLYHMQDWEWNMPTTILLPTN